MAMLHKQNYKGIVMVLSNMLEIDNSKQCGQPDSMSEGDIILSTLFDQIGYGTRPKYTVMKKWRWLDKKTADFIYTTSVQMGPLQTSAKRMFK